MLLGEELLDGADNLFAAVRGSRLVMVTVETAGITPGAYAVLAVATLGMSGVGEAGESMTGEAGESNVGEAGESIMGEAGDSTIVNTGESMIRRDEESIRNDVGESMSGESGGARRGESSPADFLLDGSYLSLVSEIFCLFFVGSSSSVGGICPFGGKKNVI